MKKLIIAALLVIATSAQMFAQDNQRTHIIFGTRSHPTCSDCCEGGGGICLIISAKISQSPTLGIQDKGLGIADWTLLTSNKLEIKMIANNSPFAKNEDPNLFLVNKDYKVDASIAKALGLNSLIIKKGKYKIDYTLNRQGTILVDAISN